MGLKVLTATGGLPGGVMLTGGRVEVVTTGVGAVVGATVTPMTESIQGPKRATSVQTSSVALAQSGDP